MTELRKVKLRSGTEIWMEAEETPADQEAGGMAPVSRAREGEDKAVEAFDRALGTIQEIAEEIHDALDRMTRKPDEVAVELGVKFSVSGGVIIAKGGLDTNFKLTLGWKNAASA